MRRYGVKHSVSRQIAACIIAVALGIVAFCWLMNTVFLGRFYLSWKQSAMRQNFVVFSAAAKDGRLYGEDYLVEFEKICASGNLQVMVISSDNEVKLSSQSEFDLIRRQLYHAMFQNTKSDYILYTADSYTIERQKDEMTGEDYLLLWGTLPDSNTIVMRTAMTSIQDSVSVTSQFFAIAALISIGVSVIAAVLLSRRITRPLWELTRLSRRMAELDFEASYTVRPRPNEIDILGEQMNRLSRTLKDTIRMLRQANADLTRDLHIRDKNEQMRRDFLSNVSHELKTPIALIRGYAEGLAECVNEDDPESRSFYCEVIMDEAKKMNETVQQLLSLNRIEFGEGVIAMERFDLVQLICSIIDKNKILFEQDEIKVQFNRERKVFVWADEFSVETVFSNYLSNAIHHAKGEKIIRVLISEQENGVRVSVYNSGDPIPEESLPKLWEKFYKVDKARTREYGGSGIGLSIVKAVMDNIHKDFGVCNETDGVTFWFEVDK